MIAVFQVGHLTFDSCILGRWDTCDSCIPGRTLLIAAIQVGGTLVTAVIQVGHFCSILALARFQVRHSR